MTNSQRFESRTTQIDYDRVANLYHVGSYRRDLPVSLARMMENAYDWEHLPFVHSGTFSDIELVEEGDWGWRAEVGSAKSKGKDRTLLELLVDKPNNYWATTVVQGEGEGVEIHTQATARTDHGITVEVHFYTPSKPGWLKRTLGRHYLRSQYRRLYDEDEQLMLGRQQAIDALSKTGADHSEEVIHAGANLVKVGLLSELDPSKPHVVSHGRSKFCVAKVAGEWVAYSALCPHQLGSLSEAAVTDEGVVTCPWHGYRFDVSTGKNLDNKCGPLKTAPALVEREGQLFLEV